MQNNHFSELEDCIGYTFTDRLLLLTAITHSTYTYEHKSECLENNERLEFVGDGILDFVIADHLYRCQSDKNEGYLSKTRSLIVCEATLAEIANKMDLGRFLLMGKGEEMTGGRVKPSNLANTMEALFAAVYLDGGFEASRAVITQLLSRSIDAAISGELIFDYKSRILELAQVHPGEKKVRFEIVDESGPVHDRIFTSAVILNDVEISRGFGQSKKLAEQEASKIAYNQYREKFS